jgi:hypothetical protein
MGIEPELINRATLYADRREVTIDWDDRLGNGQDGAVWKTDKNSAVKAFYHESNYRTELRCYQRLRDHRIEDICGLEVPVLVDHDDELRVIEMDIVEPPYILDFGKAYIDEPPPYSATELATWQREWIRYFPRQDLPKIRLVLAKLRGIGIDYVDPKPSNIRLHDIEIYPDDDDDYYDFEMGAE